MAKLTIREKGRGRIYEICEDIVVVGAGSDCNVVLRDPTSSKLHCQIRKAKDGYRLIDLETKSGTQLNGEFVNQSPLKSGDKIQIGEAVITFEEVARIPLDVPKLGERVRRKAAAKPGLPPNAVAGLIVAGVALVVLILVIGFRKSAAVKEDERIYREAMALYDAARFEDALSKLMEIERIPLGDRTNWVVREMPDKERDIKTMIESASGMKIRKEAEYEMYEIDKFAYARPAEVDEIHRRLDAWAAKYRELLGEMPVQVERMKAIRENYPKESGASAQKP